MMVILKITIVEIHLKYLSLHSLLFVQLLDMQYNAMEEAMEVVSFHLHNYQLSSNTIECIYDVALDPVILIESVQLSSSILDSMEDQMIHQSDLVCLCLLSFQEEELILY